MVKAENVLGYTPRDLEKLRGMEEAIGKIDPCEISALSLIPSGEQGRVLGAYKRLDDAAILLITGLNNLPAIQKLIVMRSRGEEISYHDLMPIAQVFMLSGKSILGAQNTGKSILVDNGVIEEEAFDTIEGRYLGSADLVTDMAKAGLNIINGNKVVLHLAAISLAKVMAKKAPQVIDDCVSALDMGQVERFAQELFSKTNPRQAFAKDIVAMTLEAMTAAGSESTPGTPEFDRRFLAGLLGEWQSSARKREQYPFISWAMTFLESRFKITLPHLETVLQRFSDDEVITVAACLGQALNTLAASYKEAGIVDPAAQKQLKNFNQAVRVLGQVDSRQLKRDQKKNSNNRPSKVKIAPLCANITKLAAALAAFVPERTVQPKEEYATLMAAITTIRQRQASSSSL